MGTATDIIWAAGAEAADIITAGTSTAAFTDARAFAGYCFCRSIARTRANAGDMDGRANRRDQFSLFRGSDAGQPSPISTAIRIRSEWFFALSFCLSSEVVLATVL